MSYDGAPLQRSTRALKAYRRHVQMVLQDPSGASTRGTRSTRRSPRGCASTRCRATRSSASRRRSSHGGLRPPERFLTPYPHELSGGQRQRVVIAGALALEPDVLVADEPVSALDASVRGEILALLLRLRDELGLTVLVVTHDLGLAWNIADRIAVMYLGRIVEIGAREEVLGAPRHPYTRALLSVVPESEHLEQVVLSGEPPDPTKVPAGCRFHPRCPALAGGEADRAGVAADCRAGSLPVLPAGGGHRVACLLPDTP